MGLVDEAASGQQAFQLHMSRLDITMVPIGDIHYIENRQCEDAIIVGSFSNTDPGVELTLGVRPAACMHARGLPCWRRPPCAHSGSRAACMHAAGLA